ncbi:MAG: hypothetical protein KZQ88_01015 [Candidatus Thiodiazotropha sp. (ex Dulcina madagascariensis)]|nr:hypothetical protein [Candidatus Thiodiazotropha sp. (ex Epidulcina cf. delphinae)]MCU7921263.1 hypothetical protein [Candidatus Thiodiazotropha sp. (ex Dulcina madagascariensis)]MCU7928047.1 hypothetical protein [Candidatus Thiodiazotropha sp. (ex Dulcina madagascariensis)]
MTGSKKPPICSECTHQIVSGIACDWQPHECPLRVEKKRRLKSVKAKAFFLTNLLIADDFDAVRSSN